MSAASALIAQLDADDIAALAERLRPALTEGEPDRLLTPAEAAAKVGIHPKTLTRSQQTAGCPAQ